VFDWTADADMSGGFRVDEAVAGGAQTFLHVLSFGNSVTATTRSDAGGRQGVLIELADGRDVTVRFSTTGVDGTLLITAAGGGTVVSAALAATVSAVPELSPG
jgi:type 1 fimbria pilin